MNKLSLYFRLLITVLLFSTVCYTQNVENAKFNRMLEKRLPENVPTVSVNEVDTANTSIVFLDTRERNEFDVSHIKNARFIGYKDADLEQVLLLPKSTEIIVYCSVGYRSGKISKQLIEHGFSNVRNLYGGIFEWSNQEMPLVDNNGDHTVKIHAYSKKWGKWITYGEKSYE